jgi:LPS-assembly lipoprotein
MRRTALKTLMMMGLVVLTGCGFELRGQAALPFDKAYVAAAPSSILGGMLKRQLEQRSKLVNMRNQANIVINLSDESRDKSILTLSSAGKVQEYRLVHKIVVSVTDPEEREILPPVTLQQTRDFSYNSQQALATDAFEASLHHDMDEQILQQIMRRLAFVHQP